MEQPVSRSERLERTAMLLEVAARQLLDVVETVRRAADAEALRDLARGHRSEISAAQVRSIIDARRLRAEFFHLPGDDPAWALLLELFACQLEGRRLTMTALGRAADLPATTAQRWETWLEENGFVARAYDPGDERRVFLRLTEDASDSMRAYLTAALSRSPWLL